MKGAKIKRNEYVPCICAMIVKRKKQETKNPKNVMVFLRVHVHTDFFTELRKYENNENKEQYCNL